MINRKRSAAVLRASLVAALIGLGLVAADMEVQGAAVGAWHDAYGAALASRGWEGMIEVGDAFLRIGGEAGTSGGSRPNARQAYLNALIRAHRDGSPEGMRRTAEAFAALGDHAVANQCLRVAAELAAGRKGT